MLEPKMTPTSEGRICYVHAGQGDPVLLLHSMGNSSWSYHLVMDLLGQHFAVYALDMLGHGDSDKPSHDLTMQDFARSCVDFMDHHGMSRAHVVGNSVGGTLTVALCHYFPDRVSKAVLVGCPAYTKEEEETRERESAAPAAAQAPPPPDPTDIREQLRLKAADSIPMTRRAMYALDALALFPTIQTPTLVLFGDQDALVEQENRFRALPNAQFATIVNAGHVTMLDQPGEFSRVVLDFLRQ